MHSSEISIKTPDQIVLETLLVNNKVHKGSVGFATSLCSQTLLSEKQKLWITRLINETMGIPNGPLPPYSKYKPFVGNTTIQEGAPNYTTTVIIPADLEMIDASNIFKLFENVKLKHPKIQLKTKQGTKVHFAVAGKNSKYAGSMYITARGFGSAWYATIKPDLNSNSVIKYYIEWRNAAKSVPGTIGELREFLIEFNKDPVKMTADYGKLTSSCCYCHKTLSTPESLAVGYGPQCAKHWSLPWGFKSLIMKNMDVGFDIKESANTSDPFI